jgi:hypothetical protein
VIRWLNQAIMRDLSFVSGCAEREQKPTSRITKSAR